MGSKVSCTNHLDRDAQFLCPECDTPICTDCVDRHWAKGDEVNQCKACGAIVQAVTATSAGGNADPGPRAYLARLGVFVQFPFRGGTMLTLFGLTLITAPLYWSMKYQIFWGYALLAFVLARGIEIMVYFRFIHGTANGNEDVNPADYDDVLHDLSGLITRYLMALLPIILGLFWYGSELGFLWIGVVAFLLDPLHILNFPGPALCVGVGILLLPLLTLIAAISQSALSVLNPVVWAQSLRAVQATYPVTALLFYIVFAVELLVWTPLLLQIQIDHSIPVLTTFVTSVLAYWPMALRARLLGGLAEPHYKD